MACMQSWNEFRPFPYQNEIYRPQSMTSLSVNRVTGRPYDVTGTWSDSRSAQRDFFISSQGVKTLLNDLEKTGLARSKRPLHSSDFQLNRIKVDGKVPVLRGGKILNKSKKAAAAPYGVRTHDIKCKPAASLAPPSATPSEYQEKTQYKLENLLAWMQKGKKKATDKLKKKVAPLNHNKPAELNERKPTRVDGEQSLREVLSNKDSVIGFRKFLSKEMSVENLDFWLEVENYKKSKSCKQTRIAPKIYAKYLSASSEHEINVDSEVRQLTNERLRNPDSSTFDLAQSHIYQLMESDSFRRYTESIH
uniref:Regulator of G-protein signaling 18 n=1 Tax=Phallusia mammillata TaxID=59560 RepID=A0A6F9DRM4_9ASCI|nr:regulator of G-protein signaling 18 [Phallusia mammillata]